MYIAYFMSFTYCCKLKGSPDPLLVGNTLCPWNSELLEVCIVQGPSSAGLLSAEESVDATWSLASDLGDRQIHVYALTYLLNFILKCRHTPFTNLSLAHIHTHTPQSHTCMK